MSRTMIEKLGFQDPDKQNPNHDLACQYLTLPKVQEKIRGIVAPPKKSITPRLFKHCSDWKDTLEDDTQKDQWTNLNTPPKCTRIGSEYTQVKTKKEHPISKGEMQYKTTIGFMDIWMTFEHHQTWGTKLDSDTSFTFKSRDRYRVIIEVKTVINVGEILRQLKLYSEYVKGSWLVLVSTVPVTSLEHQALSDEGVVVVVLGEFFERWKASRMSEAAAGVWEV